MTSTTESVIKFLRTLPLHKKRFCALTLLRNITLEAAGHDPIVAIGILECALLDLHRSLDEPIHDDVSQSFEELTN